MESLERKLEQLSPAQRNEVEDFVDFLLSRTVQACTPQAVPALDPAPPPFPLIEPVHVVETPPVRLQDLARTDERGEPTAGNESVPAPVQEIGGGIPDRISRDYMDYGQFEHQSSPAAEAVTKVKRKIIAREEQEKPRHLLDWID
jgi:hypothetical protein